MAEELKMLGLTSQEIAVYEALVKQGRSLASEIASTTKLNRSFVYHCLQVLEEKGLVTTVVLNKKQRYTAASPSQLLGLFKENEIKLKEYVTTLTKKEAVQRIDKPDVRVFYGKEGMKTAIEEELSAKELLIIGSTSDFQKNLPFYRPGFHLRRIEKSIPMKVLFYEEDVLYSRETAKMKFSEVRLIPNHLKMPMTFVLFNDITLFAFWAPVPHTIRIKNKETTERFKEYFKMLWSISKPLSS